MAGDSGENAGERVPVRLGIRLLGSVEVSLGGRRLHEFESTRLQKFLALIALRPELRHRASLAFELWPDSEERQARTNLRKLLHEVRQVLPDIGQFFEIDKETVALNSSGTVEVDVWMFQDAIRAGDNDRAARVYSGDLLPACYDDCVLSERDRLRRDACAALVGLVEEASARHDHQATIALAGRIIDLEPTDEMAVRTQMEALVALGDRAGALRAYHRCVAVLERELDVAPGESTEALYQQIRADTSNRVEALFDKQARVVESPFVGRLVELAQLDEAWAAARQGAARLVLVAGEPGIGKTRLAQELGRRIRAEGHVVASARAYEAAGRPPWGPVVDLLRSEALRSQLDTLDAVWRAELARLLPELLDPSRPKGPGGASDLAQRYRLLDAVSRAVAAGGHPRLLIIDDLQWCDVETIEMIGFVIRAEQEAPILIVGTVRPEELPERHPLRGLVDALTHDGLLTSVPLDRLDEASTAALAARFHATDAIDPALAERLWSETEGNPLFVVEAIRAGLSAETGGTLLTPTMRAVLGARLGQLTETSQRLAQAAAVIGRPFSVEFLASVTAMAEHEVVDHVDELWRRRIIRDQGFMYDFSHDKLRAVALEMVSPARRRQLHRAVAEAMARDLDDTTSTQLAAHYDHAGLVEPAIEAYRVAGARAVAVSALEEAIAMFRRALALLADVPASPDRDALELDIRVALGSPLVAREGYGSSGAHQLYERALSLCRRLGRPVDPPILRGLGLARLQGCRFEESQALGQALLEHEPVDPIIMTEGCYLLGVSAFWRGDLAGAREHLEAANETYDESHREQHLALYAQDPKAVCLVRLALVDLWEGDPGRADHTSRAAFERTADLNHLMTSWYVLTYASILAAEAEDHARLHELLGEVDRLARRLPMRYLMIVGEALRGWVEVSEGSSKGVELVKRSVVRSRAEGETLHLTYCLLLLARTQAIMGRYQEGQEATREALSWSRRNNQHYLEAELWRVDGELAHSSGQTDAAAASFARAVDVAGAQGANWLTLRALNSQVRLFPGNQMARERLQAVVGAIRSGRDLPAFRCACEFLGACR